MTAAQKNKILENDFRQMIRDLSPNTELHQDLFSILRLKQRINTLQERLEMETKAMIKIYNLDLE